MKRIGLIVAGALLAGCATNSEPSTQPSASTCAACAAPTASAAPAVPAVSVPAAPAAPAVSAPVAPVAPAVSAPIAPAVPHKDQPVFELTQDGKVYVFASVDAMTAFTGGQQQPTIVEKPNFTPSGKTVVFEAADQTQAASMLASYNKLHPVAK